MAILFLHLEKNNIIALQTYKEILKSKYRQKTIFTTKKTEKTYFYNKSITMMRGKSPRSDVEMTKKKLNFVAAILDF